MYSVVTMVIEPILLPLNYEFIISIVSAQVTLLYNLYLCLGIIYLVVIYGVHVRDTNVQVMEMVLIVPYVPQLP